MPADEGNAPAGDRGEFPPPARPGTAAAASGRWPPRGVWIALVVYAALLAWFRRPDRPDSAVANIATLIVGFLAVMTVLTWFSLFSRYRAVWRLLPLGLVLAALVLLPIVYRIDYVTGDLFPAWSLRWRDQPDRRLAPPATVLAEQGNRGAVDLATTTADDFPQFLGPRRNQAVEHVRLRSDWQAHPPQLLWRQEIGAGWSGFAVVNGLAVTIEQRGELEAVTCYERLTGVMRWAHSTRARHATLMGDVGPRSTPTIDEGRVYALGATGVLLCLDGATGEPIWRHELQAEYGVTQAEDEESVAWGRAASPLIVEDLVVVPAGGPRDGRKVSLVAFDKRSGAKVWEGGTHQISYSSPCLATLLGERQILIVLEDFVAAHDPRDGRQLWEHPWPGKSSSNASASQPVPVADDRVLLTKGYGVGALLLEVARDGAGQWSAAPLWQAPVMKTKFSNVVVDDGYVYGLDDSALSCIELATGRRIWKRGRYNHGQILRVGRHLLVQAEAGTVVLVQLDPQRHTELGSFPALDDKTWNNPCLSGPYLLVRNSREAACYKLALEDPSRVARIAAPRRGRR